MQDFINEWLGKSIDFDHVFGKQCVDLIKQYMYEKFSVPNGAYGNAVDYWTHTAPQVLARFDKVNTKDVQAGDIVPLNGMSGNPYGHVGLATGAQTADTVEILEQNGHNGNGDGLGGNAIRKRFVPKSRVLGVLRPKPTTPPPHTETVRVGTWNVRRSPDMGSQPRGTVKGGQQFDTLVVAGGWRRITFNGAVGFVGPKAW